MYFSEDRLPDQLVRMRQEIEHVELVLVHRIVEAARGAGDLRREQQEQHDVGDIHLDRAPPQPLQRGEKPAAGDDRPVDPADQITGDEDEEFGGVAEAVIAQGQPGHDVVRDVVEEDHPQTDAAEEIEPQIALDRREQR